MIPFQLTGRDSTLSEQSAKTSGAASNLVAPSGLGAIILVHFEQVQDWANSAAQNRGGALDDHADEEFMKGPNKKRQLANRKYGFGGKTGRFKQNDRATLNDISGFNPRGNFGGMGTKKSAKSKSGSGANRQGKRARDANRSRRR